MHKFSIGIAAAFSVLLPLSVNAEIKLPAFFGNGMVLQRDGDAPVWGTAAPGEGISVGVEGQTVQAKADDSGHWKADLKGLAVGGPFTLTIKGASGTVSFSNVLVGDVWLCSGQSNMVFSVSQMGALAKADVAAAQDPQLRWFSPKNYFVDDFFAGRSWTDTTPETAPGQSAVAFYFGRKLRTELKIPIGIICNAFPGSSIEGWMTKDAFDPLGMGPETETITQQWNDEDTAAAKFLGDLRGWETNYGRQDPGNKGFAAGWADPKTDISKWQTIPNMGDWSSLGLANGGVVWIRKSFDIAPETAGKDITLVIGYFRNDGKKFGDILGTVYLNNQQIGTVGDVLRHIYTAPDEPTVKVPGNLLVAGTNVLAIRFFSQDQKAPWTKTALSFRAVDKKTAFPTLTPDWQAQVEAQLPPLPADALASRPPTPPAPPRVRVPSLFNGILLQPFVGYGIKGVIWYQGEANTETAGNVPSVLGKYAPTAYGKLLPAMIADWRHLWNQPDLPFYIVQLPNTNTHDKPSGQPEKSDWAALRESQLLAFKTVANTGLAVTIDVGNGDLHPPNKQPVGERVATAALSQTYGQKIESSGPIYGSMQVEGDKVRVKFTHIGGGLMAKNGPLAQFAIAGADLKFVWADASIDGDTVVVSSSQVATPVAVRYGWSDNPPGCNLYNKEGLPASPFRTDDQKLR
jgi:sialate O-acetylesterase